MAVHLSYYAGTSCLSNNVGSCGKLCSAVSAPAWCTPSISPW